MAVRSDKSIGNIGLVCVFDFMNLVVTAFHVGTPTRIHAVKSVLWTVANTIERLSPEYVIFAMDGGHAERSRLFPDYKAHRPEKPPELVAQIELAQKAIAAIGWPMLRAIDWEADDVVASIVTSLQGHSAGTVVCSRDKDLLQLLGPAQVYHPWDQGKWINKQAVFEKYGVLSNQISDYLALCGDKSDGIPGVAGIGPKTAAELLATHKTLDGILEAARLERILGAVGKKLKANRPQAELSRKLVTLRSDIPLPSEWLDWPAREPRAGWVDELRALELGIVVNRLSEILPASGRVRSGSSLVELRWEQATIENFDVPVELIPVVAETISAAAETIEAIPETQPVELPARTSSFGYTGPSIEERTQAALKQALETDFTRSDWWVGFPVLAHFPANSPREMLDRSIYASVRSAKHRMENDWRNGTSQYHAHALALDGLPFSMPGEGGLVSPTSDAISPQSEKPLAGSLF